MKAQEADWLAHPVVGDGAAVGGGEEEVRGVVVETAGLVGGGAHHDAGVVDGGGDMGMVIGMFVCVWGG